jgi:hypothetical protein
MVVIVLGVYKILGLEGLHIRCRMAEVEAEDVRGHLVLIIMEAEV